MNMADNDFPIQPIPRGIFGQLLDRFLSWLIDLPSERCNYTTQSLRTPVSDGSSRIELLANLLQPLLSDGEKLLGTVLVCSPYGRGLPIAITPRT